MVEGDHSHPIAKGCILERPKVVYNKKTGKYVMWFHLELKGKGYGSAYAGVATAAKPTGPFKFLKAGRVNPGKWPLNMDKKDQTTEFTKEMPDYVRIIRRDYPGGQMSRDMTIFVDDNGKAYHIYSSEGNITLHIAELTPDYTGHTGKFVRAFPGRFMEAPAIFKHKGKYYLIASGCTGWAPNAARSAVAKNIAGPWMELKNPCVGPKAGITFGGQSTFILPVQGKPGKFIFMADIWRPKNAIDGRYLWLPMKWEGDQIILEWKDEWTLDVLYIHLLPFYAGYGLLLPSPCRKAEAEPSVCLVLRSPCCSSLAASSGMAFLGGLHCLGTRLRGNADCSTHHSPFHPLPALRKRRALFCSANSGRTKKAGYRHHAGMPGLRFHLLHGRLFALAGKNYPPAPHLPGRMGRKICP